MMPMHQIPQPMKRISKKELITEIAELDRAGLIHSSLERTNLANLIAIRDLLKRNS